MPLMIVDAADLFLQRFLPESYAAPPEWGTGTGTVFSIHMNKPNQLNKQESSRKLLMSTSMSSTIKEVQGNL